MINLKKTISHVTAALIVTVVSLITTFDTAFAESFNLSPMYQNVSLTPGEKYVGNFQITNLYGNTSNFDFELLIEPFTADNDNNISLTANGDYNQITNWIHLFNTEGSIKPNETEEIRFEIDVPEEAPAGGQYASIVVRSKPEETEEGSINLQEIYQSAHLIYADIAGETVRKGEINSVNVPGFLFSGDISGNASIKNAGNVHSRATQTFQVFPLFSNEEVYTNEENPDTVFIMPGNTRYSSISWDQTPSIGIFHVIYNVEFEGVNQKVDKMVIVCPLWLLFIIAVVIFLIIFKILSGKKK